jgi:DNA-directed RNA polymerase subunit E'
MFKLIKAKGVVRIPPEEFDKPLKEVAVNILRKEYEGKIIKDIGFIVSVFDVDVNEEGMIILGDGATYHKASFSMITYLPEIQEVVEGEVTLIDNIGARINIGPFEVLAHRNQIFDDKEIDFIQEKEMLVGKQSKKVLRKGDIVRAKIATVSLSGPSNLIRISVTMKQPYLGKLSELKKI